jgi:hypothetical protein
MSQQSVTVNLRAASLLLQVGYGPMRPFLV